MIMHTILRTETLLNKVDDIVMEILSNILNLPGVKNACEISWDHSPWYSTIS